MACVYVCVFYFFLVWEVFNCSNHNPELARNIACLFHCRIKESALKRMVNGEADDACKS